MSRLTLNLTLAALLVVMYLLLDNIKEQDALYEQRQAVEYCLNVAKWESGARQGLSEFDRVGHPNYERRNCKEQQQ